MLAQITPSLHLSFQMSTIGPPNLIAGQECKTMKKAARLRAEKRARKLQKKLRPPKWKRASWWESQGIRMMVNMTGTWVECQTTGKWHKFTSKDWEGLKIFYKVLKDYRLAIRMHYLTKNSDEGDYIRVPSGTY